MDTSSHLLSLTKQRLPTTDGSSTHAATTTHAASQFAMPFAYGSGIAKIDFGSVQVVAVITILVAKTVLFAATAGITILLNSQRSVRGWSKEEVVAKEKEVEAVRSSFDSGNRIPPPVAPPSPSASSSPSSSASYKFSEQFIHGLAKSGIFGIFVTQANDVAFGVPIIDALYPPVEGQAPLSQYCYLSVAISLGITNVFGYVLMELSSSMEAARKRAEGEPEHRSFGDEDGSPNAAAAALTDAAAFSASSQDDTVDHNNDNDDDDNDEGKEEEEGVRSSLDAVSPILARAGRPTRNDKDDEDDGGAIPSPRSLDTTTDEDERFRVGWSDAGEPGSVRRHHNAQAAALERFRSSFAVLHTIPLAKPGASFKLVGDVALAVLSNPSFVATIIGFVWAGASGGRGLAVNDYVDKTVTAAANTFNAMALFMIGYTAGGTLGSMNGKMFSTALLLSVAKVVLSPLIWYLISIGVGNALGGGGEITSFLYVLGAFPTSPGVLGFAVLFNVQPSVISLAIVVGTLLSAPALYTYTVLLGDLAMDQLVNAMYDMSAVCNILSMCLLTVLFLHAFVLGPRVFPVPHAFIPLAVTQLCFAILNFACGFMESSTLDSAWSAVLGEEQQGQPFMYATPLGMRWKSSQALLLDAVLNAFGASLKYDTTSVDPSLRSLVEYGSISVVQQAIFSMSWIFERAMTCWSLIAVHRLLKFIAAAEEEHMRLKQVERAYLDSGVSIRGGTTFVREKAKDGRRGASQAAARSAIKPNDDEEAAGGGEGSGTPRRRRLVFRLPSIAPQAPPPPPRVARQLAKGMAPPPPLVYTAYVMLGWLLPVILLVIIVLVSPEQEFFPGLRCWVEYGYVQVVTGLTFNLLFIVLIIGGLYVVWMHRASVSLLPRVIRVAMVSAELSRREQEQQREGPNSDRPTSSAVKRGLVMRTSSSTGSLAALAETAAVARQCSASSLAHPTASTTSVAATTKSNGESIARLETERLEHAAGSATRHSRQFVSDSVTVLFVAFCQTVALVLRTTLFVLLLSHDFGGSKPLTAEERAGGDAADAAAANAAQYLLPVVEFYQAGSMQVMLFSVLLQNLLGFLTAAVCLTRTAVTDPWARLAVSVKRRWTAMTADAAVSRGVGEWWGGSVAAIREDLEDQEAEIRLARQSLSSATVPANIQALAAVVVSEEWGGREGQR